MKKLPLLFIFFFAFTLVISCDGQLTRIPLVQKIISWLPVKTEKPEKSEDIHNDVSGMRTGSATVHLDQNDEELARIAEDARDSLPLFFRHFLKPAEEESGFRLKYPFRADSNSGFSMEQLWLRDITFKDGVYYGAIDNTPFYISAMKKSDVVSFSADEITDWMYISNGKIVGGRSIKYLLEQVAEHERDEEQRRILEMF